jgi:signal transduction histidine kinase
VCALAVLVLVVLVGFGAASFPRSLSTFALLRNAADALLLLAGAAQLTEWRLTGRAAPALTGAGFVVTGGLMLPLEAIGMLMHRDQILQQVAPGCVVVLGVAGAYLCLRSTLSRSVVSTLRPTRESGAMALASLLALGVIGAIRAAVGSLDGIWPWSLAVAVTAVGWLVAAAGYARPQASGGPNQRGLAGAVAGIAVSDGLLAWGLADHPTGATVAAAGLVLAGGAALGVSATGLQRCLGLQGSRTLRLAGELGDTVRVLAGEQEARQQMLHDARSTLAAIRLANGTLTKYQEQLDEMLQNELREAMGSELVRLEHLLTHDHGRERTAFALSETLTPVVRVARDAGLDVTVDLSSAPSVVGRPADTTTVVHSLLTNAARYAGAGSVEVTARVALTAVQIVVADRGPGIDPDEREAIFGRGVRGRTSEGQDGSGLGLFIARWLMDEQEGSLQVEERPGGGACFVASLPMSSPPSTAGPVAGRDLSAVGGTV